MKGKLGRVLFRKIGGRIIPIRISNVADKISDANHVGNYTGKSNVAHRKIQAILPDKTAIATMNLKIPKKGKTAEVQNVEVAKAFRRKGISKNLFARATQFLERSGYKFLRSEDLQSPAQVKIRSAFGRYKAGAKGKNRTKFFADQFGPYGENTKRISKDDAIAILRGTNEKGRQIKATTMLKKKK